MSRADPQRKTRQAPSAPDLAPSHPRRLSLQDALDGAEPEDDFLDELEDGPDLDDDIDQQELAARREDDDE
jgi:hypothetical protein